MKRVAAFIAGIFLLSLPASVKAQQPAKRININEAISIAKNNLQYDINELQINKNKSQNQNSDCSS